MAERWQNQEEAYQFAMAHKACMLDMEMGTGKTRVAIDVATSRVDVARVLVVCPKAVLDVWPKELAKHSTPYKYECWWRDGKTTVAVAAEEVATYIKSRPAPGVTKFVIVNYDAVWRKPMGDMVLRAGFDMVILDESHRAKAAGSKVSKYLAMLGKRTKYKMCLSGTPMANSPLDVYGQYRFLDPTIFGTNHDNFMQRYAIMGGPDRRFVLGYINQKELSEKFHTLAYTCKMSDVASQIKLPDYLPPTARMVNLPARDMRTSNRFAKKMVSECGSGVVTARNALVKMLRLQQITAGFCQVQDGPLQPERTEELNTAKKDCLADMLKDLAPSERVAVFCVFKHDLDIVAQVAAEAKRGAFELSGRDNTLEGWKQTPGAVLAVQIQAGAEGVDMTCANHAVYFSLPHSLAMYNQSRARLYRPGQTRPVVFTHIIAANTVDESMYKSLIHRKDIIEAVKDGSFDFGFVK